MSHQAENHVPLPADEPERLEALRGYAVLDTEPEQAFDTVTRVVTHLLDVPMALVTLVDEQRQWFKSACGLPDLAETPRSQAFCAYTVLSREVLVVPDARRDERFRDNELVLGPPYIRFYAGAPLITPKGYRLGSLCALDTRPRASLPPDHRELLRDLAGIAMDQLELRLWRAPGG